MNYLCLYKLKKEKKQPHIFVEIESHDSEIFPFPAEKNCKLSFISSKAIEAAEAMAPMHFLFSL
jgi:hypothetical protein